MATMRTERDPTVQAVQHPKLLFIVVALKLEHYSPHALKVKYKATILLNPCSNFLASTVRGFGSFKGPAGEAWAPGVLGFGLGV